ncbi:hypothetical protein N656DRAFT_830954 [Canariomyces notabilis]|uniref:RNA polymerase II subunit B1 CTD phosphatase RPAP2 homolog n=1 Tax=Canariomyces notabilis TaxID=2074819 RepID=A0AAN6TAP6_9PEZI|nr:hypothetical protein N656DRAFT_830954 [Canariomyces arenarius]
MSTQLAAANPTTTTTATRKASSQSTSASASLPKPPKSILKKTTPPAPQPKSPPSSPPPPATSLGPTRSQLQHQQDRLRLLQQLAPPAVPLETIELLTQLPTSPNPPPASHPSPTDRATLLTHLPRFQPREYLDLIEERTILGKCGYVLCGRPRRDLRSRFKISTRTGNIARTEDLNKWCSDECARRGMYIKVQLDNPSFVRGEGGRSEVRVELLVDDEEGGQGIGVTQRGSARGATEDQEQLARDMARLAIDRAKKQQKQKQKQGQANALLAAERGEGGFLGQDGRVEVTIREKATTDEQVVPPSREDDAAHLMLEGYKTTFGTGRKPGEKANGDSDRDSDDDDDDFPTIRL